jgi:putative ABC transport system ATP-binding protein
MELGRTSAGADALAVRCRGIEKSFGEGQARVKVLRGTDFEARAGEMTFLVGPSGCGKTTLISVIGAILSCDGGSVEVLGEDLRRKRNARLAEFRLANFGFIFQQFNLLPALSAAENASVPLVAQGMSTRKAEKAAAAMLDRLGIGAHVNKSPAQLSGGQQQRVAIARALVHAPRLVICDEPTASLDAASGHTVMELLRDTAMDGGRTVIVVTHDNRIFGFADRIARMSDGVIAGVETTRQSKEGEQS